jgi:DNA-binding Lrp family transcriptional regulator
MQSEFDQIDGKLIAELAADASQPINKIAKKVGITRQTAASRISKLKDSNVLNGFRAKIDFSKIGYNVFFVLFLKLGSYDEPMLASALSEFKKSHNVIMDASVTGEWDIMQVLAFKNATEYDRYISNLRKKYSNIFRDSKSHAILRIFKSPDDFVPS